MARTASKAGSSALTTTSEVLGQVARSAARELSEGAKPFGEMARAVASDMVETLDRRGPDLAEEAGIMNWRYAALGWLTWRIGKRVLKRRLKAAFRAGQRRAQRAPRAHERR